MIKSIVTNKEVLAIPSSPVQVITPKVLAIIQDLRDTAEHHATTKIGCAGLAANQISHLYRIVLVWNNEWIVMINPEVRTRDGKMGLSHEGCLSRPGVSRKIRRHKRIVVHYMDKQGVDHSLKLAHLPARVVQHEVDHLDGIFI
jgi:peptide deformylase